MPRYEEEAQFPDSGFLIPTPCQLRTDRGEFTKNLLPDNLLFFSVLTGLAVGETKNVFYNGKISMDRFLLLGPRGR